MGRRTVEFALIRRHVCEGREVREHEGSFREVDRKGADESVVSVPQLKLQGWKMIDDDVKITRG